MTSAAELLRRREMLLERCAADRSRFDGEASAILGRLQGLDRGIDALRRVLGQPVVIVGVVALALLFGRMRSLRFVGRTLGIAAAAWRARGLLMSLAGYVRSARVAQDDRRWIV
jgi:hypothetical protein